jgi:hypothetical protein
MNNDNNNNNGDAIAKSENATPNVKIIDEGIRTFKVEVRLKNANPTWEEIEAAQAALGIFPRKSRKTGK